MQSASIKHTYHRNPTWAHTTATQPQARRAQLFHMPCCSAGKEGVDGGECDGGLLTAVSLLQCSFNEGGQTGTKTSFLNQKDHKTCRRGRLQQTYRKRSYRLRVHSVCFRPFQKGEQDINPIYSASYMRFMPPSYHQSGIKQPEEHR